MVLFERCVLYLNIWEQYADQCRAIYKNDVYSRRKGMNRILLLIIFIGFLLACTHHDESIHPAHKVAKGFGGGAGGGYGGQGGGP